VRRGVQDDMGGGVAGRPSKSGKSASRVRATSTEPCTLARERA
jgi:hypothetical protein